MNDNISFIQPKDAWDALSIPEKAEMMRVAVSHGIYNLKDIRQKYNEFAMGGDTEEASVSPNEAARMGAMVGAAIAIRPKGYIGGSTTEARKKYWQTDNEMKLLTDSVANQYGISPDLLRTRMDNEGYTDARINEINKDVQAGTNRALMGTALFNSEAMPYVAGSEFGLDDVADYINNGTVNLINENWGDGQFRNEQGRWTHMAMGRNYSDNVGIMAATLKALKDIARKDFPNASDADLERYASAYYNRGIEGGRKWVKRGAKGYKVNKHSTGGNLFGGTTQPSQQMQIGLDVQGWPNYTTEQLVAYGEENERRRKAIQDAYLNFVTESNDATAVANGRPQNQHLVNRAVQGAKAHAAWEKEHPNLTAWSYLPSAAVIGTALAPLGAAGWTGISALGDAAAATSAGQAITAGLTPIATTNMAGAPLYSWANVGLSSLSAGHGAHTAIEEGGVSPMTALELLPLGQVAKPAYDMSISTINRYTRPKIKNEWELTGTEDVDLVFPSDEEIKKINASIIQQERQGITDYYNSEEYLAKLQNAGMEHRKDYLINKMTNNVSKAKVIENKSLPNNVPGETNLITNEIKYNPYANDLEEVIGHEFGHASMRNAASPSLNLMYFIRRALKQENIADLLKYNQKLAPIKSYEEVIAENPGYTKDYYKYLADEHEKRQRAYTTVKYAKKLGMSIKEFLEKKNLWPSDTKELATIFTPENLKTYVEGFLSIGTPLTLYLNSNEQDDKGQ